MKFILSIIAASWLLTPCAASPTHGIQHRQLESEADKLDALLAKVEELSGSISTFISSLTHSVRQQ
jgi:hypothetical protein